MSSFVSHFRFHMKVIYTVFVFVCLTYLTMIMMVHPCCCKWRYFTLFCDCKLSQFADLKQFVISCDLVGSLNSASWHNNWILRRPTQKMQGLWRSWPRSPTVSHLPHSMDQRHGATPDAREKEADFPLDGRDGHLVATILAVHLPQPHALWQRRPTFSLRHCVLITSPMPVSTFLLVKWRYWGLTDQKGNGLECSLLKFPSKGESLSPTASQMLSIKNALGGIPWWSSD